MRCSFIVLIILLSGCARGLTKEQALSVAEKNLVEKYGEQVLQQRPFMVSEHSDFWVFTGTLQCSEASGCKGGVASIKVNKKDGLAAEISHSK